MPIEQFASLAGAQANRGLEVTTALGPEALVLTGFSCSEAISSLYTLQLDLLSPAPFIPAAELLRTPVTVAVELPEGGKRVFHGLINRFTELDRHDRYTSYQAEVVPWLWFLSLSRDCRIYQDLTVLEIIEQVFQSQGYSDFEIRCGGAYPKREYCVQYRETHLDFVSRLMEEEGIFYFFEHSAAKHVLVLADSNSSLVPCPDGSKGYMRSAVPEREEVVHSLTQDHAVHFGKVALKAYDYLQPSLSLLSSVGGDDHDDAHGDEEVYDYPGSYTSVDRGEHYARRQLEAEEAFRHVVRGESTCRGFQSGCRFDLEGHHRPGADQPYLLLKVQHFAESNTYRSGGEEEGISYRNAFLAIPYSIQFRPIAQAPKPLVRGSQTAVVVGKEGEEIWVDKYGRVKVQFHWDRVGRKDENSSCWVRVSTAWAGKQWGAIQIPRIGQEVIVDFLEGDPDRPIITGRVYNADQMPPYELPANQTQSGIKSRSSKDAGADNFNELRFEDKKGEEQIYLHAEKDLDAVIENSETRKVGFEKKDKGDQTIEVFNNRTLKVGAGEGNAADGSQTTEIYKDQTITLKTGNQTITLKQGDRSVTLDQGSETVKLTMGNRTVTLDQGSDALTIKTGNLTTKLQMGNASLELDMGNATTKAKLGKISEEAMQAIEMKVGQNSIKVDQTGVTIKGMMVKIEGQVQTQIKGLMTQVNGDAMLQVKGGITMIN